MECEKKVFMDVARESVGRMGDVFWLQLEGRELRGREDLLGRCLVGRWVDGPMLELDLASLRR